ncbi:MAG: hypothetical protein EP340_05550 [Alphaproteobacteria bacterium]|nr:MAG: hypothetical protein EP340_05550 [Alphaproteobacteria bacterium]
MSLKTITLKTALLTGLLMTGVVLDPAQAMPDDTQGSTPSDESYSSEDEDEAFDFEALPEDDDTSDGFEDLIFEPIDEEPGQPENIALLIETGDNAFTMEIYFPTLSAQLTQPAEMVVAELASALETQENARITIVANSTHLTALNAARIKSISTAFGDQGLPGAWVQVNQPITLAAAY